MMRHVRLMRKDQCNIFVGQAGAGERGGDRIFNRANGKFIYFRPVHLEIVQALLDGLPRGGQI